MKIKLWSENLKVGVHSGYIGVEWKILLKCVSGNGVGSCGHDGSGLCDSLF